MSAIKPITMPKWGLAMEEGLLARWAVEEGAEIAEGQEIMDIETTKIANVFESPVAGTLRRKVVTEGDTVPVGALLGVVAAPGVAEAEVEAFVGEFLENFKPAEKGGEGAPAAETIEVNGRKMRHLRAGPETGTPILLIHGFGADMSTWMFNQGALAEDFSVHAIDLPGHGGSSKEVGDGSTRALAATVVDYMDAVGIGAAHLVGHSLGGAIAVLIAHEHPDRVAGLTLIAPGGLGPEIAMDFIEGFIAESRARKLRPVLEMLVANPSLVTADMVEEVLKFKRLDGAAAALRAVADANFAGGRAARLAARSASGAARARPDHLGRGRPYPAGAPSRRFPPAITVTRIAGAGHIPHMEKASEVNALIRAAAGRN